MNGETSSTSNWKHTHRTELSITEFITCQSLGVLCVTPNATVAPLAAAFFAFTLKALDLLYREQTPVVVCTTGAASHPHVPHVVELAPVGNSRYIYMKPLHHFAGSEEPRLRVGYAAADRLGIPQELGDSERPAGNPPLQKSQPPRTADNNVVDALTTRCSHGSCPRDAKDILQEELGEERVTLLVEVPAGIHVTEDTLTVEPRKAEPISVEEPSNERDSQLAIQLHA